MSLYHTPVMLDESVSALVQNPGGIYADVTFGGGGHTAAILSRLNDGGRVIAFDRDSDALENPVDDPRLEKVRNNYRFVENYRRYFSGKKGFERAKEGLDGILADLGVSSHQFDTPERGFSFRYDAPLDMRMNPSGGKTAAEFIAEAGEEELGTVLRRYGEVENAGKAASLIVKARSVSPVDTTTKLNAALSPLVREATAHKYLAKVYQALRIEVNGELRSLEKLLEASAEAIREGGRLVVITYHSLEDRMVKNFIRTGDIDGKGDKDVYGRMSVPFTSVLKKPMTPSETEISTNTRARSAKLRVAERNGEAMR